MDSSKPGVSSRRIKEVDDCFSPDALQRKRDEVEKVMKRVLRGDMYKDDTGRFIRATLHDDVENITHTLCCRDAIRKAVIPELLTLEEVLMRLAIKEAETVQMSYNHHCSHDPITFGFSMANYVSRIGDCIVELERRLIELQGKLSGPTGAYNAPSLFHPLPDKFDLMVLEQVHLKPAFCSPQGAPFESRIRLMHELMLVADIMAELARRMNYLQRLEIDELMNEAEGEDREPFHFIAGLRRTIAEHLVAARVDDRSYQACINAVAYMTRKLHRAMKLVKLNRAKIAENLNTHRNDIGQNALCVILTALGHPRAHEKVKELFMSAQKDGLVIEDFVRNDIELHPYFGRMTMAQKWMFLYPELLYVGYAARTTRYVVDIWARTFNIKMNMACFGF